MDDVALRRERRQRLVEQFLAEFGVSSQQLATSTNKCLDEWARQLMLVQDQPSANLANVVLQLCCAVEAELAVTLGREPGLEFLAGDGALGDKARRLSQVDARTKQRLTAKGVKVGLLGELQRLLSQLARIRRETRAAHGGVALQTATSADAKQTRQITGTIFKRVQTTGTVTR